MPSATIRAARSTDAGAIAAIYAPFVRDTATSFEIDPPDADAFAQRIAHTTATYPWLVYADGPDVLGYAYACIHRARSAYGWSVEVSAYIHPDARRQGVGRGLYTALLAVLVHQGFYNAYAGIVLPNDASEGLHAAMGFEPLGVYRGVGFKNGAWHDVAWWSRDLQPRSSGVPEAPIPIHQVEGSLAYAEALAAGLARVRRD